MKSFGQIYGELRHKNMRNYVLLLVCNFISVLLITSFAVMMQSRTVQTMLPEGGDSRKQMTAIFTLAIVGCAIFTTYASSLFFRAKSRETGIYMALGARKKTLAGLLFGDLALVALVSSAAGVLLGTPLAMGIWQLFRTFVVDNQDMAFILDPSGYMWPLAFALFSMLMLFFMGWRFIRRSNIIDVVNEQRKTEPVKNVKPWTGIVGIVLMVVGVVGAVMVPRIMVQNGFSPPAWSSLLYILAAVGVYLVLVFVVVRGFGGRKSYYKNIISRSMMKFQGRQTVLNMCVIAALVMGSYFAVFYAPMQMTQGLVGFNSRPVGYAFHHRTDETGVPDQSDIEAMAQEEGVQLQNYQEVSFSNLATDGYFVDWLEDGRLGHEYFNFYEEESFLPESAYNSLNGGNVDVQPGYYVFITTPNYNHSPYDYIEEMERFTNPTTMETLDTAFQEEIHDTMMHGYILLDDADYEAITEGLGEEWKETWAQFDAADENASYAFAKRLKNAIIDGSTEKSSIYNNYDWVERMRVNQAGEEYFGDTVEQMQLSYDDRDSSEFNRDWRYIPIFRVLDLNDMVMNLAVFLMLFIFMAIICLAAVIVIAYTRCLTIALNNRQVYDDLRHLGAKRDYLYRSVKGQVSKVFTIPITLGTVGISAYFVLLMYSNSGGFDSGELLAFAVNAGLILGVSALLYLVYRLTLRKVSALLGVKKQKT